jgi:hypothetical protein
MRGANGKNIAVEKYSQTKYEKKRVSICVLKKMFIFATQIFGKL